MSAKRIIVLGTCHQLQLNGHPLNAKLEGAISLIRGKYGVQIILEEWVDNRQSFASTLATANMKWENVGTPDEPPFETFQHGLNCHPPTHDPTKPMLPEYGPVEVQELREYYMVNRVMTFMEPYGVGLLIAGLAHVHSILSKFRAVGFEVAGYSWID